jgi:uncharacterized lipoprotein YddW (UPF0748 family)
MPSPSLLRRLFIGVALVACGSGVSIGQVIVDNADAGFSVLQGSWSTGSYGTPWGSNYHWAMTTDDPPTAVVEWRPTLPESGWYDVDVYYVDGTNRADNAPFTIHHADGTDVVPVNQQIGGGTWVPLGAYYFDAGTAGAVELANNAGPAVVIADAVRFDLVTPPEPQFRGMWADAFSEGFKNASQIDAMVARAQAGNYNAIVAEVMAFQDNASNAHGAYWESDIIPKAPDVPFGFDPLDYMIQQAHLVGIEVHAWLVAYRVSSSWPPAGNALLTAHPEWIGVPYDDMNSGPRRIGSHYLLDPGSPDVQEYLISIVREITANYAVDGIHWDYIRYTQEDAGYPAYTWYQNSGLERFKRIAGYGSTPLPDNDDWRDFRRREVTELVRRAQVEVATADNPRQPLRHTAAVLTWGNAPADFTDTGAYARFQDWEHWLDEGYLDAGIPMTYFDETEYPSWYRNWVDQSIIWSHDRHLFTGQAPYQNTFANSNAQISYAQDAGVEGIVTYSYSATSSSGTDWTWYPYIADNAFAAPAVPPPMPWRDAATATRGVIYGRVADGATGASIDDAIVYVNGFALAETDGNGFFVVTELNAGVNGTLGEISAWAPGYALVARPNVLLERAGYTQANLGLGAWLFGDADVDGDVDADDWTRFHGNLTGPDAGPPPAGGDLFDLDTDLDVDLLDFSGFQVTFGT